MCSTDRNEQVKSIISQLRFGKMLAFDSSRRYHRHVTEWCHWFRGLELVVVGVIINSYFETCK